MQTITKTFERHAFVEEEIEYEGELLEEEYTILKSNIEKIARKILAEYNQFLLNDCDCKISNESLNNFISKNL